MYDFLRGIVVAVDAADRISFDVNGVGYLLRVSKLTRAAIPLHGGICTVYVRLIVREDDLVLFGFSEVDERVCFDLLTSVQGIGPAAAMSILGALTPAGLKRVLINKLAKELAAIKGIGPKGSERIITELAAKADKIPSPIDSGCAGTGNIAEQRDLAKRGLIALGFKAADVSAAIDKAIKAEPGLAAADTILRAALAVLR